MAISRSTCPGEQVMEDRFSLHSSPLTASFLSSPAEVLGMTPFIESLTAEPGMLAAHFFLASMVSEPCKPCVVAVSQGKRIAGLVYCQERKIAGVPTGVILADATLDTMVAARPEEATSVVRCALEALLRRKIALRWRIPSEWVPLLQSECARARVDAHFRPADHHAYLKLPRSYEEFLGGVGRSTRHNLSRYRQRSEVAGNQFCADHDFAEFCAAAERLLLTAAYAMPKPRLQRSLAMIAAMPSQLLVGLRRNSGEWISLAGLWCTGDRALMALQLNDRSSARESVSLVLRSYLIEELIRRGIRELVFLDGVSEPLSFYTEKRKEFVAYIDSRSLPWVLVRRGCAALAKLAPQTFTNWREWQT
jgi:hypothetical protein